MSALRILLLCIAAAMVCASIRSVHPQIASAVALAAGVAAMALSLPELKAFSDAAKRLESSLGLTGDDQLPLLRLCGVALVAEFASDICRDSGEAALARRIETSVRIAVLAASLPMASELLESLSALLI